MTSTLSKKHNFDTVFDSQQLFRLILEAVSNPARVFDISTFADKLYGGSSMFLAVAMTLLDNEVSFNTYGNQKMAIEIAALTLAKNELLENADFIFVGTSADMKSVIMNAKCGTLSDPHKSATVIIKNNGEADGELTLSGPGIDGQKTIQVTKTVKEAIALRDAQHYEYPQGIDMFFISSKGEFFAIPRLVVTTIEMGVE
jgi:alpha-D-ribose 1-methylphosphonate 5-triphosphate synthase subunit PhnH